MRRIDAAIGAVLVVVLWAVGIAWAGETEMSAPAPSYYVHQIAATLPSVAGEATDLTVELPPAPVGSVATIADRGQQVQVTPTPTAPPQLELVPGDCDTWRGTVERYGMPWDWASGILRRESGCTHALADRPSTGDRSIGAFQINYYSSSMAAWWTDHGWTWALVSADPEAAIAAAGALYAACGSGPWDRAAGYPCRGDGRLRTTTDMGYTPTN